MTHEVYYSKDKTTNSTHVKTIIGAKTIILAIHIHSTLATCTAPLAGSQSVTSLHVQGHFTTTSISIFLICVGCMNNYFSLSRTLTRACIIVLV